MRFFQNDNIVVKLCVIASFLAKTILQKFFAKLCVIAQLFELYSQKQNALRTAEQMSPDFAHTTVASHQLEIRNWPNRSLRFFQNDKIAEILCVIASFLAMTNC
ncbi:hypothetical protein FFWV33_15210 [Flavobacterium faecale]|uniref:Uncharacterized protein n=1 Tax=Flavobacterium faecale TaxID=1355330 RepID=A0A2S1LG76_9FLAO|nr:hypothetical protein FFWV33_15210 [Flavobacterium faecale]